MTIVMLGTFYTINNFGLTRILCVFFKSRLSKRLFLEINKNKRRLSNGIIRNLIYLLTLISW